MKRRIDRIKHQAFKFNVPHGMTAGEVLVTIMEAGRRKLQKKAASLEPFLTGSYVYGKPTAKSDIDLVVLFTDSESIRKLKKLTDGKSSEEDARYARLGSYSLRFGRLNLLCFESKKKFLVWKKATEDLKAIKPVTRQLAKKYIEKLLREGAR
jgi:predicted nucleotidyltransferase